MMVAQPSLGPPLQRKEAASLGSQECRGDQEVSLSSCVA